MFGLDSGSAYIFQPIVVEQQITLDIKPAGCPNPLNVKSQGVIPAAILGTEAFDVTQVDPDTLALEGVAPLRWGYEDVATPYTGVGDDAYACAESGADGYMDITLKFRYVKKDGKHLVAGWDLSSPMHTQTLDWTYEKKARSRYSPSNPVRTMVSSLPSFISTWQ